MSNLLGRIFGPGAQSDQSYGNSFANLQANPMFNVGLNLLSGGNWAEMVQKGLLQTDKYKDYMRAKTLAEEEEERRREEEERRREEQERRRRLREAYPAALDAFFPGRVVGGMEMSPQPQPSEVVPGTEIVEMGPPTPPVIQQDPRRAIFEAAGPEKGIESLLGVITAKKDKNSQSAFIQDANWLYDAMQNNPELAEAALLAKRGPQKTNIAGIPVQQNPITGNWEPVSPDPNLQTMDDLKDFIIRTSGELETAKKQGQTLGEDNANIRRFIQTDYPSFSQKIADLKELIAAYERGDFDDTTGWFDSIYGKYGTAEGAAQEFRSVMGTLEALQITKLTPVSNFEIDLVKQMAEDPSKSVKANIGRLKEMVKGLEKKLILMQPKIDYFIGNNNSIEGYTPKGLLGNTGGDDDDFNLD